MLRRKGMLTGMGMCRAKGVWKRTLCCAVLALCLAAESEARVISGEGSLSGESVRLNAQTATVRNVSLSVVSTGAGWARSSFAQARGISASGNADFVADGLTVQARSGKSLQEFVDSAAADSTATATGVQVQGRDARSFAITDMSVQASAGEATAVSQGGELAQARSSATATGLRILASGSAQVTGISIVEAKSGATTALGGRGESVASAEATGVRVSTGDVLHDGSLRVAATGGQAIASSSAIYAEARAMAVGLQSDSGVVRHSGDLSVIATAGSIRVQMGSGQTEGRLPAQATGISAAKGVHSTGLVSVTAEGGTVTDSFGTRTGVAVASGILTPGDVSQTGNTTVAAIGTDALATGISGATVTQSGTLSVTSSGTDAVGIGVLAARDSHNTGPVSVQAGGAGTGIITQGDIFNTGLVSVQAGGAATGLNFLDSGSLTSWAPLSVSSSSGENWEVVAAENAVVRVKGYNLGLGSGTGQTFGGPGQFTMDQARLLLRPTQGFVLNTFYRVQSGALPSELGAAAIDGEIASVVSLHPDLVAELASTPLPDPASAFATQSVALTYSPPTSLPGESAKARLSTVMYTGTVVRDQLSASLFRPLGGQGETARVFARPYASNLRFDGSPAGYKGRMAGAVLGVDWLLSGWTVGLHGGGDETRLDFKGAYEGREEKSTAIYGGLHAGRLFENGLAPMFTSTLFRVEHRADLGMDESARSRTLAWYNTLGLGYVWRVSDAQIIVPELTLSHVWQLRRQHETDTPALAVNTRFGELNDHEVYVSAGLRWIGEFPLSDAPDASTFRIHAGGGVRRTLTDGKISVDQTLDGVIWARPEVQSERTAGFFSAGFGMRHQNVSWDITAQADVGRKSRALGMNASVKWDF